MWSATQSSVLLCRVKTLWPSLSSAVQDAQVRCQASPHPNTWCQSLCLPCDFLSCVSPPPHSSSDEPRIPAGLRASVKSCRYNGTIYQPGETFNKHNLFPSKQSNQCVMCTCSVSYIAFTSSVLVRPGLLFYGSGERISHSETDSLWSYRGDVGLQWAMKPEGYRSLEILCVCMDMVKQGCWGGCSIPLNRGIIKAISR